MNIITIKLRSNIRDHEMTFLYDDVEYKTTDCFTLRTKSRRNKIKKCVKFHWLIMIDFEFFYYIDGSWNFHLEGVDGKGQSTWKF